MSSLYFRGSGSRRYVWISYRKGHKRYAKPLGIKVENPVKRAGKWVFPVEAIKLQRAIDLELRLGILGLSRTPKSERISQVLDAFLKDKEGTIAPSTIYEYRNAVRAFYRELGDPDISTVMADDVASYRAKLLKEHARNTAAKQMRHLHALFEYARKKNVIQANVIGSYTLTSQPKEVRTFGIDDLKAFFAEAARTDPPLWNQAMFLLLTGVRAEESCQMMWDEIDLKQRVIRLKNRKGRRDELFPIDTAIAGVLSNIEREDAFVFRYRDRFRLHRAFEKIRDGLQLTGLSLHSFKKTFTNALYDSSQDILSVSDLAHHSSINVTWAAYLKHRAMDRKREVLEGSRAPLAPILKRGASVRASKRVV